MQPHLVRWDRSYRDRGLTIVYVANGAKTTPDALLQAMRSEGAQFPVLLDTTSSTTNTYGVRAFPTAYVLGKDGAGVWEGIPVYDPGAPERAIQAALASR